MGSFLTVIASGIRKGYGNHQLGARIGAKRKIAIQLGDARNCMARAPKQPLPIIALQLYLA